MKKYIVTFHMVNGNMVRVPVDLSSIIPVDTDFEDEKIQDRIAHNIAENKFLHFFNTSQLTIINMRNVTSIDIAKPI